MLLIGSLALKYNDVDIQREPKDIDLVGTYDEVQEFIKKVRPKAAYPINSGKVMYIKLKDDTIVEIEIAWPNSRAKRLLEFAQQYVPVSQIITILGVQPVCVANLELLLLLKESHKYLKNSPHFWKTMADIKMLRQITSIPEAWFPYLKEREKETYNYSLPKLNVGNKEFFDSEQTGVHQVYDHDSIHEVVALRGYPAYKSYQPVYSEVMCSKEMFFKAPYYVRLCGVVEEAMVLALERSLVPYPGGKTPEEAFRYALMKVCTSITGGWFREWAWEHHDEAVEMFMLYQRQDGCFAEMFFNAAEQGKVRLKEQ